MKRAAIFMYVSLSCLTGLVFWVSLAASINMDYAITEFTFGQAVSKAATTTVWAVFQDNYTQVALWFLVSLSIGIIAPFILTPAKRIVLLFVAIIFACFPFTPFAIILGPTLPIYLVRASDGETWGEAWPAMSAIGLWMLITLCYIGIQLLIVVRPRRNNNCSSESKPQPGVVADGHACISALCV